jgi:hypothetical protein
MVHTWPFSLFKLKNVNIHLIGPRNTCLFRKDPYFFPQHIIIVIRFHMKMYMCTIRRYYGPLPLQKKNRKFHIPKTGEYIP